MNSIDEDKSGVDFKYFIKLAIQKKLTWDCVANILDQLTSNLQLSKHLNSILLEELKESESKQCTNQNEHLQENVKVDAKITKSQDDQDFEFDQSDTEVSENFDHKEKIAYNFEYDFVGSNGIETKKLTIFNSPKDGTNKIEGQNGDENCDLKEQENIKQHANEPKEPLVISQESLNDQFELPKSNEKYHCKKCDKVFAWQSNLIRHEQIHKEKNERIRICEKKFKCKNCSKGFASKNSLNRHNNIHKEENPYVCNTCSKACSNNADLIKHERIHSGEKPFTCQKCYKSFNQKSPLILHEKYHSGEIPHKRKSCFKNVISLNKLKRHSSENKLQCKNCNKGFASKSALNRHDNIHREDNPFICKTCSKAFTNITDLNRHETVHSGVKPFECKICKKAFAVAGQLRKHERIHAIEKP